MGKSVVSTTEQRHLNRRTISTICMFAPAVILLLVFYLYPMIMTIYYAFTNLALTGANALDFHFVGLENFKSLFSDPKLPTIIQNTLVFLLFSGLIGQMFIGFFVALLMRKRSVIVRRFTGFAVVLGWVVPEIVAAYMFSAFFSDKGTLNVIVKALGFSRVSWTYSYPMLSVIIANIWKGTAYSMLMFQAALDSVSDDVLESAKIDGANKLETLTKITLPIIKGTVSTVFIIVTLGTLGTFGMIYAFTGGGPGVKTTTLSVYMYLKAFGSYQIGYGTSIGLILLSIGAILSFIYMKVVKSNED